VTDTMIMQRPSRMSLALRYIRRNKSLAIGLAILLFLIAFTVIGFMIINPKHAYPLSAAARKAPSLKYWLGTDFFGRDLYAAMVVGMWQTALAPLSASSWASCPPISAAGPTPSSKPSARS